MLNKIIGIVDTDFFFRFVILFIGSDKLLYLDHPKNRIIFYLQSRMNAEIQTLHNVWSANRSVNVTDNHQISFNELTNAIVSTGPFSFFIMDFYDMSISHVSDSVYEMHASILVTLQLMTY